MTNGEKILLRQIADNFDVASIQRLKACDKLAAADNVYLTSKTQGLLSQYVPTGTRPRREVIRLLRKLLHAERYNSSFIISAIHERLLFIRTGSALTDGDKRLRIWKLKPNEQATSGIADPEIEAALKRFREGNQNATGTDDNRTDQDSAEGQTPSNSQ
jgi:hypothetical protein